MISARRLVHHPLFHLHYTSNACSEPRRCAQCRRGSDDWLEIAAWTIPRLVECYGFCVVEPGSASIVTSTSAPVFRLTSLPSLSFRVLESLDTTHRQRVQQFRLSPAARA